MLAVVIVPEASEAGAAAEADHSDVVSALLSEALALLDSDSAAARRRIETVYTLVQGEVGGERAKTCLLAGWQVKRVQDFIRANLAAGLRMEAVASLVSLSASYFSRAFKATTGLSYSEFVAVTRVERAKRLLLTTELPISEIALICGLADQSHLTRLFSRAVGLPPMAWRRQVQVVSAGVGVPTVAIAR